LAKEVLIIVQQSKRTFVEKLDFVTSVGFLTGGNAREAAGLSGNGPVAVITDLCILRPDPDSRELKVTSIHPDVNRGTILANTGWSVVFAESCEKTPIPTRPELDTLRDLKARTAAVHSTQGDRE
jgi:glutaconate CoA-transferase subunit B